MNYFDHAASSVIYPEVLDLLDRANRESFANPSAQHLLGHALKESIADGRADFLKALGAGINDSFIFTSSATESNNTVIRGLAFEEGDIVLYSKADHPSLVEPILNLKGVLLKEIPLSDDGLIDEEGFKNLLSVDAHKIKLVALTHVNNQSGAIQAALALALMVKEKSKAHVHVDAVQSFGKIPVLVGKNIDSLSITSHKIGGPKGIAGLYLKKGHAVRPLLLGGGQEEGLRSSTQAYPLILAFNKAMKISAVNLERTLSKTSAHYELLKGQLLKDIPTIKAPFKTTSPFIFSFILPGISSDIVLRHLEMREVYISSTSACSSRKVGFNPSLYALGIPEKFHKNFLRISLGPKTTTEEVESLLNEFQNVWRDIKHLVG
ncbi:MAG: cysteine desulfurase family protein [Bacteriovorax sp.]